MNCFWLPRFFFLFFFFSSCLDKINKNALVWTAIWGDSFGTAAVRKTQMQPPSRHENGGNSQTALEPFSECSFFLLFSR